MTPRAEGRLLVAVWVVVGGLFCVLASWNIWFLCGLGVTLAFVQRRYWKIRCLKCGARLLSQSWWLPWFRSKCSKCGTPTDWRPEAQSDHHA